MARAKVTVGTDTIAEAFREVVVRAGQRPVVAAADDDPAFDAREVASTIVSREFAARLARQSSAAAGDGRRALDRLAAADFPGAVAAFEAVLRLEPRDAAAAFLLGWAYHGAGDDRQAISAWRRSAYLDPTFVPAHLALVDLFNRLSQPALALQAVRAGLAVLPDSPELAERLTRLERR